MGYYQYLAQKSDKSLNWVHCRIVVTGQNLFSYFFEKEERRLIIETFFVEKEDQIVHTLAITDIGVIYGKSLKNVGNVDLHNTIFLVFLLLARSFQKIGAELCSKDIFVDGLSEYLWYFEGIDLFEEGGRSIAISKLFPNFLSGLFTEHMFFGEFFLETWF